MKSALLIIAPRVFRDEEYALPRRVLEAHDVRVVTASAEAGECVGKLGMKVQADLSIKDALGQQWDAVAFIGGGGATVYFDDADAHELARSTLSSGAVLGAICIAPSILAHAGLLSGVNTTSFASQRDDLISHGAVWKDEPVVVDGTIVTANGPESAEDFGQAIVDLMRL